MRKIIIASLSLALYGCIEVEATNKVDGYECARKAKELKVEYHYRFACHLKIDGNWVYYGYKQEADK